MSERTRSWFENWLETDGGGPQSVGLLGSVAAVLSSTLVSVVGYGVLPAEIRIHWTLGAGPYYGPEFAPTAVVLALFPALIGLVAFGSVLIARYADFPAEQPTARLVFAASMLGVLVVLLGTQVGLVVANL